MIQPIVAATPLPLLFSVFIYIPLPQLSNCMLLCGRWKRQYPSLSNLIVLHACCVYPMRIVLSCRNGLFISASLAPFLLGHCADP
ncbi:hypothetical protein BX070DRAFT_228594 [Coemansia spiralis]|nr:hypothetical protein BX070DRAFT_228594 [Coemansia spiralis]